MNTLDNNYDSIEKIIFEEGLKIDSLEILPQKDFMLIYLTNTHVLKIRISLYDRLKDADINSLKHYQFIANGTGIHWPSLDEDLSLKGFLREFLRQRIKQEQQLDIV